MNDNDLARLLPVPAERDLPADRKQILEEHLMTELRQADQTSTSRTRRLRRRPVLVVGAVLAAAAVAGAAVAGTNALSAPSTPTPVTAAQLLDRVAAVAASQPAPAVPDSDFTYVRAMDAWAGYKDGRLMPMPKLTERQIWLSVSDLCITGLVIKNGDSSPISPFPVKNGKVDRTPPPPGSARQPVTCPDQGGIGYSTYRWLQSLPTEPSALLAYLKSQKKNTNDDPPTEIGDMINEMVLPPDLAAALYRVAAKLPGATLEPHVTNVTGQPGIGIMWTGKSAKQVYRTEWIFDKTTLQFIGARDYDPGTGQLVGESAIVQRGFTAKAGEKP